MNLVTQNVKVMVKDEKVKEGVLSGAQLSKLSFNEHFEQTIKQVDRKPRVSTSQTGWC
jgi:hypothetical protein